MNRAVERYFLFVVSRPKLVLAASGLVFLFFAAQLPRIRFDNRPDSFIPPEHPALIAKQTVERKFGLEDAMVVAIVPAGLKLGDEAAHASARDRIFDLEGLALIRDLSQAILDYLQQNYAGRTVAHPVYSLATELDVEFDGGLLHEFPFLDPFPDSRADLERIRDHVFRLELYNGVIVSDDGNAGAIVVVPPPGEAGAVNEFLQDLIRDEKRDGWRLLLAGEAAVRSTMGDAVAADALRLNPLCALVVTVFLWIAFRSFTGVLLPFLVVGAGSVIMLGLMFLCDKPVYIITNSIVVTIMSLGVADAIHVQGEYYDALRRGSFTNRRDLVMQAMRPLWIPIAVTSLTDAIAFVSFLITGSMPPFQWFGLFTAAGVLATMTASFSILPAGLMLTNPDRAAHQRRKEWGVSGIAARLLGSTGEAIHRHPARVTVLCAVWLGAALLFSLKLQVNQSMVSTFDRESDIVQADNFINRMFDGTYFLDVMFEKQGAGDLLDPKILARIRSFQHHAAGLPHVKGSLSVADFARKMHQILNDWDPKYLRLPDTAVEVREHFDLLDASPTKKADLHRLVSVNYRLANVRLRLSSGWYQDEKVVVEEVRRYLNEEFPPDGNVTATLAGRVNMDYHWVALIVRGHIRSVLCTFALIFLILLMQFRSVAAAVFCVIPVAAAVVTTYAAMAVSGIELSIGTSMFASLAIGVGVNFPIHMLHRIQAALKAVGESSRPGERHAGALAYRRVFALTGKALAFNALAVCCGFLVLVISELPLLRHFGFMIALGIGTACLVSLTLLPALAAWLQPAFLYTKSGDESR